MALTYGSYLKLDELLQLQQPHSEEPEHDEMLFIVVHQVYELWFKEVLHEIDYLQKALQSDQPVPALKTLKRILTILKVLVAQLDILETMTPLDFLSFRDRLETGSGFQSYQFRALELVLGLKDPDVVERFAAEPRAHQELERRLAGPSVWDAFLGFLDRVGYAIPASHLQRAIVRPPEPSPEIQAVLIDIYRSDSAIVPMCERLVDLDEGLQEWRYRHVKMVQRTIGTKPGTGGSTGAEYLMSTLNRPIFPDLWAIRADL